jgi:hypothetical protein
MGDLHDPTADEAVASAAAGDAPQDPVQAAKDEAWLAQFRADNAAKVMEYDYKATAETQAEQRAAEATRDYDLRQVDILTQGAAESRAAAVADDKKAEQNPSRRDEYAAQAEIARRYAAASEATAGTLGAEAKAADAKAKELGVEVTEEYKHLQQDEHEFEILQEQAVAAQRIATDEARLAHPGDSAPADPGAESHAP